MVSLADVAKAAGVSIKTASGALNGSAARMSDETRERIVGIARELGYVVDMAARATRQGGLPIVGLIADGLVTSPFATEIMRVFDNALKGSGLSVLVSNLRRPSEIVTEVKGLQQFRPRAQVYASMFHKMVDIPPEIGGIISLTVNCQSRCGNIPAIVPADEAAGLEMTEAMIAAGHRRIAFLNLPGLHAGHLREAGFHEAHRRHGLAVVPDFVRPAVDARIYHDRARSLVQAHLEDWFSRPDRPGAILCGNDRVALEVYNGLRRLGLSIPGDVGVASFDNQVELATRLDPPLTTMALPHRAMARAAASRVLDPAASSETITRVPFSLVWRESL